MPMLCTSQIFDKDEVEWLPHSVGSKNWRPLVGFDSRRSFFNGRSVKFLGVRLGAEHRKVHRFGLAFYGLTQGQDYDDIFIDEPDAPPNAQADFDVSYATFFYERVIMTAGKWEISAPLNLGGGRIVGQYRNTAGVYKSFMDEGFSILSAGAIVKYRILPWLEPGIGGGYRHAFNSQTEIKKTIQSPFYIFKVSLLLGELYRTVTKD